MYVHDLMQLLVLLLISEAFFSPSASLLCNPRNNLINSQRQDDFIAKLPSYKCISEQIVLVLNRLTAVFSCHEKTVAKQQSVRWTIAFTT
ncbi:hypothetical protein T4B_12215 [Trichinella pseudospiralis]|uniref:Secreted protein n=1 Tax=Trichinella pseudospiralis TaxID=6337 RepID=A0A0V1K2G3_TRIPS|nr:hypothetical protein T4A_14381 [Trichinella pseudospiralis]KRZ26625.1 hypothetical protein T4B_12215 [Trichinella pseudospiralis]KRZ41427.1 hypothetical protein T4C_11574 [Trichinella pseudospiralis]